MTPLYFFIMLLVYIFEGYIVFSYGNAVFESKYSRKKSLLLCVLSNVILYALFLVFKNEFINGIAIFVSYVLIFKFVFESKWVSNIFNSVFATGTMFLSEYIIIFIFTSIFKLDVSHLISDEYMFLELAFSTKLVYYIILKLVSTFLQKNKAKKNASGSPYLAILPLSTFFVTVVLRVLCDSITVTKTVGILCLSATILMIVSNVIVFAVHERTVISQQKLHDIELSDQRAEIDMEYLKLLEKKDEETRVYIHDIKNHLTDISELSSETKVKEYVASIYGTATQISSIAKTKNKLLDVIINKYSLICKNAGIKFEYTAINENLEFISEYDLSAVFNNILDNAVESAKQSKEPHMNLTIENDEHFHKIVLSNSCDNKPSVKDERLITKKNDKNVHGFGIKSVKKALENYNGEYEWFYDDNKKEFKNIILIEKQ